MRILTLSIILFAMAASVGALYYFELIDFGTEQAQEVVPNERCPMPANVVLKPTVLPANSDDKPAELQEVASIDPETKAKVKDVKAPEQKTSPAPENKKAPSSQEKVEDTAKDTAKPAEKLSKTKKDKTQGGMKTLPVEDNFRIKERKRPGTLGYKHWTGWYYPTKFILTINDAPVITFNGHEFTRPTKELTFDSSKPLKAHFVWEFLNGKRAGWRTTEFELNPDVKSIFIGFDWKDEWQVIIDQATPIPESDQESDNKNVSKK